MSNPTPPIDPSRLWQIHGKYYDLEPFLNEHPGGRRFLEQVRGMDCTEVFESTHVHDRMPKAMLKRFYVADNVDYVPMYSWKEDGFYATLKRRVQAHLLTTAQAEGHSKADARLGHHGTDLFIRRMYVIMAIWLALGVGAIGGGLWWAAACGGARCRGASSRLRSAGTATRRCTPGCTRAPGPTACWR